MMGVGVILSGTGMGAGVILPGAGRDWIFFYSGSGLGRDGIFSAGAGRDRSENPLPCHPLVPVPEWRCSPSIWPSVCPGVSSQWDMHQAPP